MAHSPSSGCWSLLGVASLAGPADGSGQKLAKHSQTKFLAPKVVQQNGKHCTIGFLHRDLL